MPTIFARISLFLSSYSSFFFIVTVLNWLSLFPVAILSLCLGVFGILVTIAFLIMVPAHKNAHIYQVTNCRQQDSDIIGYIAIYIFPFLAFPIDSIEKAIAVGILLITIGAVYTHSSLLAINPFLSLIGYRLYKVQITDLEGDIMILSRTPIYQNRSISLVSIGAGIYLRNRRELPYESGPAKQE